MPGKRHPKEIQAAATALAVVHGPKLAAEASGVPAETIRHWVKRWRAGDITDSELAEEVEGLIEEETQVARVTMARVVSKGVELLQKGVEHWLQKPGELTPSNMKDLAFVVGIIQDKRHALEGRPSSVSARFSYSREDRFEASELIRRMEECGRD